uniref:Putative secreted protein n=1 Tax=Anopheles darlingi TaxID=43151 RepID=A0A2M4D5M2_ANODA
MSPSHRFRLKPIAIVTGLPFAVSSRPCGAAIGSVSDCAPSSDPFVRSQLQSVDGSVSDQRCGASSVSFVPFPGNVKLNNNRSLGTAFPLPKRSLMGCFDRNTVARSSALPLSISSGTGK